MMSFPKVGSKNVPVIFWLFTLTLLFIQAVPAMAVNQYPLDCASCHGMPPLDSKLVPPQREPSGLRQGAFQGNHETHLPAAATPNHCIKCHNNNAYTIDHYNGVINMAARINNYSAVSVGAARYNKLLFFNQTSLPVLATCSNVNCHFEKTTTVWSSPMPSDQPDDCQFCHSYPVPTPGTVSGASHQKHLKNTPAWGGGFGMIECLPCHHDGGLTRGQPYYTYQHATSAGNRSIHIDPSLKYPPTGSRFLPSQAALRTFGSCSNTYCHSNGIQGAGNIKVATPEWGTHTKCDSCHAAVPTTNGHAVHAAAPYSYGCELCHAVTVSDSNTIIYSNDGNNATHTNNRIDVAFGGMAGSGTGTAACATTYCHSGSTIIPQWSDSSTVACGSCHKADNTTVTSIAHPVHLNSASVAYGPTYLQSLPGGSAATSCKVCHTTFPVKHVNGAKDVNLSSCSSGVAGNNCHGNAVLTVGNWKTSRAAITCEDCHMGPKLSVIPTSASTSAVAPDETLSKTKGHTALTNSLGNPMTGTPICVTCHDNTKAHIGNAVHNPRLKLVNDNSQCNSCHKSAGSTIARFQNMSTHFTALGANNMLCKTCHDPHGTRNIFMIRTTLSGANGLGRVHLNIQDVATGFVNSNGTGLCQLCHTKTNHYLAGVPETNHHTSNCLTCHSHNSSGGAFKPTGGTCDSCHGYPPLPKGLAGLTFGTAGNFANGRFEDYSGGGGAHFVPGHVKSTAVASEGWSNCAKCHNGGILDATPNHLMITPVKANIANVTVKVDQQYRFTDGVMITYTGAKLTTPNNKTGTCTNVECHFQPSKRWSSQR